MINKPVVGSLCLGLLIIALISYLPALFLNLMDIDATQLALIAMEMSQSGNFMDLYDMGSPYLDKPHFLFWSAAVFYKIFGITNFSYKLTSFLFVLLALRSTYGFSRLYYEKTVAQLSAFVLGTSLFLYLMINDVRADTILMGAIIFSVWQIAWFIKDGRWVNWMLGFAGLAVAMMTKGPIGLMVPVLAIGAHLIIKRKWKDLFKPVWLLSIVYIGILLIPLMVALYNQFGTYGLQFYFWDQSFGRLTGTNPFVNSQEVPQQQDLFFFAHTLLWVIIPWTLLFIVGIAKTTLLAFRNMIKNKDQGEYITIAGFWLPLVALSFSEYKLPHYIYVILPFTAIIIAKNLFAAFEQNKNKWLAWSHIFLLSLLWLGIFVALVYVFPINLSWVLILLIVLTLLFIIITLKVKPLITKIILATWITILGITSLLSWHFYPTLLRYQAPSEIAIDIVSSDIPVERVYSFNKFDRSIHFYTRTILPNIKNYAALDSILSEGPTWIYANKNIMEQIVSKAYHVDTSRSYDAFMVTLMNLKFLNKETRPEAITKSYLLYVEK